MGLYSVQRDLYATKASTATSSEVYYVGDMNDLTIEIRGSPSTTSIYGSNADGFGSAIPANSWSVLTTVLSTGTDMVNIAPGWRWLWCIRSETTEVLLAGVVRI